MDKPYRAAVKEMLAEEGVQGLLVIDSKGLCISRFGVASEQEIEPLMNAFERKLQLDASSISQTVGFYYKEYMILIKSFDGLRIVVYKKLDEIKSTNP